MAGLIAAFNITFMLGGGTKLNFSRYRRGSWLAAQKTLRKAMHAGMPYIYMYIYVYTYIYIYTCMIEGRILRIEKECWALRDYNHIVGFRLRWSSTFVDVCVWTDFQQVVVDR